MHRMAVGARAWEDRSPAPRRRHALSDASRRLAACATLRVAEPVRAVVVPMARVRLHPYRALFVRKTRGILQTFASNDQQADGDRLRGTGWAGAALEGHGPDDDAPVAPHRGDPDRRKAAADAAARPRAPILNLIQFFIGSCVTAGAIFAFFGVVAYLESPTRRALRRPEAHISNAFDKPGARHCVDPTAATTAEGFNDRPYELVSGATKGQATGDRHADHVR